MNILKFLLFFTFLYTTMLYATPADRQLHISNKIEFDVSILNPQGLYGPENGLRSLSYEFCIPANADAMNNILLIDADIKIYQQSRGHIGCNTQQYLCIGETVHKPYLQILQQLSKLPYIKRIIKSDFE